MLGISSVQSLSRVQLFATSWIAARQTSLSITNSWSPLRLTAIESVMPSSHLILGRPLLLLPPIPLSIRVFSNESTLHIKWPKYWSFSFSIIPSKYNYIEFPRLPRQTKVFFLFPNRFFCHGPCLFLILQEATLIPVTLGYRASHLFCQLLAPRRTVLPGTIPTTVFFKQKSNVLPWVLTSPQTTGANSR